MDELTKMTNQMGNLSVAEQEQVDLQPQKIDPQPKKRTSPRNKDAVSSDVKKKKGEQAKLSTAAAVTQKKKQATYKQPNADEIKEATKMEQVNREDSGFRSPPPKEKASPRSKDSVSFDASTSERKFRKAQGENKDLSACLLVNLMTSQLSPHVMRALRSISFQYLCTVCPHRVRHWRARSETRLL